MSFARREQNAKNAHKISQGNRICDKPENNNEAGHADDQDPRPVRILTPIWTVTFLANVQPVLAGPPEGEQKKHGEDQAGNLAGICVEPTGN
jgi:hypothetical protein